MLSAPPIPLQANSSIMWNSHRANSRDSVLVTVAELGEIAEAYALVLEVVSSLANQSTDLFVKQSPDSSRREAILSGYTVGLTLVEHAILSGYTAQAASLVRQELEAIAALVELAKGVRKERKVPNICHVPSVPGKVYGDLSKLAHFSDTPALREVALLKEGVPESPNPAEVWLLSPQHVPNTTKQIFALHTHLLLHFAEHQSIHYFELHGTRPDGEQTAAINRALSLLRVADVIE